MHLSTAKPVNMIKDFNMIYRFCRLYPDRVQIRAAEKVAFFDS